MQPIEQLPGRTVLVDGERWLYCSGTAYLGVVQDPRFRELVREGIDRIGVHYGGSRLASIRLAIFEEAEASLCRLTGAPQALVLSSGTLAGQLAVRTLADGASVFAAPGVHPALWPDSMPPCSGTFEEWADRITRTGAGALSSPALLLTNSLDSLHARSYSFGWLRKWPSGKPATIIIDDSHGLGITGPDGGGIYPQLEGTPPQVQVVVISSLGKALGIPGGVILGPAAVMEQIRRSPHFGGASPPPPPFLYAFVHGQEIYRQNRQALLERVRQFGEALKGADLFRSFPGYPVFYTPYPQLADHLARRRVLASSFPYPTPADERVTRVVLNALHTEADIGKLAGLCLEFFNYLEHDTPNK